jgi:hypothetical protein
LSANFKNFCARGDFSALPRRPVERRETLPGSGLMAVAERLTAGAQNDAATADRDMLQLAAAGHAYQGADRHGRVPSLLLTKPG